MGVVTKVLLVFDAIHARKQFRGDYWKCGSVSTSGLTAAKLIKFTAVESKPSGSRHCFFFFIQAV